MINNRLPDRRLIRVRRRKRIDLIQYAAVVLIVILLLGLLTVLAFTRRGNNASGSASSLTTASSTTTTVITTTTAEKLSTKAVPVGDEYFADACFIGNSRTQGLMIYSAPDTATFYAARGLTVAGFFNEKVFKDKTKTAEAMLKTKKFGKVYVMFGLNELGWTQIDSFIKRYGDVIDSIKKSQPGAKIFIQSILPVSAAKSKSHPSFNNPRVLKYNKRIYDLCVEKKVIYLNVREAVEDKKGNLPDKATTDGIHMNKTYCDKWMDYLRTHTDVPIATHPTTTTTLTTSSGSTTAVQTKPST